MSAQGTYQRYLRAGRESSAWGTAPTGSNEYNANGSWFSFITESQLGALKYREAKIRTRGATGQRSKDQLAPVPGATKSEGSLDIPFVADIGGLLLATALGADTPTDTDDAEIKASTALSTSPQTIDSGFTQPTANMYPYLEFVFTLAGGAAFGSTSNIVVTGTNDNDETITETITFGTQASAFNVYSKLGYKTITSVVITGVSLGGGSGTVTINGIKYTDHVIACANTSSSLAIEEFGDPGAGSGNSWLYTGMTITQLAIAFNTLEDESLLTVTPTFEGKYPTAQAQTTYRIPLGRPFPSWGASVTKGGSAYARLQNFNMVITPGSRNYRAAVGSQNPQGKGDIGRMVELSGQLLVEDSTEYTAWKTPTVGDYEITITSPYKVTSALFERVVFELTEWYFLTADPKDDTELMALDFTAFTKAHSSDNVLKATVRNRKNGAY